MALFGLFGNAKSRPIPKAVSKDKNSQTDFDFDENVTDGVNIGIRVDPRAAGGRHGRNERSRSGSRTPDVNDPENMLMAERVFYGQPDQEGWNINVVNNTEEEQPFCAAEKPRDPPCKDPCSDPCFQKYAKCMQLCMIADEDPCRNTNEQKPDAAEGDCIEEEKSEVKEKEGRTGRRPCNDPCRSTSRGRDEKPKSHKSDKPRRQCSDLCRVTKKRQEQREEKKEDPCAPKDPCADPCQPKDPCPDPCEKPDPSFDPNAHATSDDPCADPCRKPKPYNPCADPCAPPDPCQDPCKPHGEHAAADTEAAAQDACPPCPPCPPCPACPPCPECPACPTCPSSPGASKGYRPCGVSSISNVRDSITEDSHSERTSTLNMSKGLEDSKSACPDPLFPICKPSDESCQSIVCPEDS